MTTNITIIGMGLIGTSLGLALRETKAKAVKVTGHDKEPTNSRTAQKKGAIDGIEWNLLKSVADADMVIIATPVLAIKDVMESIGPHLRKGAVVTDTGSTKIDVLKWAADILPKEVSFVGGHPMAGKETSGPDSAESTLFNGAAYCILPGANANDQAIQAVVAVAEAVGAKPFFIGDQEHDAFVAGVSHLPLVVSSLLLACVARSPSWHEMARLAAGGFRDTTRLASGDPAMNRDICVTNAREIGPWVDRLIAELKQFRNYLGDMNEEAIGKHFLFSFEQRERWVSGASLTPNTGPKVQVPGAMQQLSSLMMGDVMARKTKALMDHYEKPGRDGIQDRKKKDKR